MAFGDPLEIQLTVAEVFVLVEALRRLSPQLVEEYSRMLPSHDRKALHAYRVVADQLRERLIKMLRERPGLPEEGVVDGQV